MRGNGRIAADGCTQEEEDRSVWLPRVRPCLRSCYLHYFTKASSKTYRENNEDKDCEGKSCLAYFKTTPRTLV